MSFSGLVFFPHNLESIAEPWFFYLVLLFKCCLCCPQTIFKLNSSPSSSVLKTSLGKESSECQALFWEVSHRPFILIPLSGTLKAQQAKPEEDQPAAMCRLSTLRLQLLVFTKKTLGREKNQQRWGRYVQVQDTTSVSFLKASEKTGTVFH